MVVVFEGKEPGQSSPAENRSSNNALALIKNQKGSSGGEMDYGNEK
jgi:hypothetical protein